MYIRCFVLVCQVFSCSLSAEDETALSIIDPMSLNIELNNHSLQQATRVGGLLDLKPRPPVLEVDVI